jgi:hypothetical protein
MSTTRTMLPPRNDGPEMHMPSCGLRTDASVLVMMLLTQMADLDDDTVQCQIVVACGQTVRA